MIMTQLGPNVRKSIEAGSCGVVKDISELQSLATLGIPDHSFVMLFWGSLWYLDQSDTTTPTDGITVVASPEGTRWKRVNEGIRGAEKIAVWYIDSNNGNDENDGLTTTSQLKTIDELFRRLGSQFVDGKTTPTVDVYLTGDFTSDISFNFFGINSVYLNFRGTRIFTGPALSPVTAKTSWNGATHAIHSFTVPGQTWNANTFYQIIGGDRDGQSVLIAKDLGSGVARSPGWFNQTDYVTYEVEVGDVLRPYSIPKIGSKVTVTVQGNGSIQFFDCDLGNSENAPFHNVTLYNPGGYSFFNCIFHGLDNMWDAWTFLWGCAVIGFHNYGWVSAISGCVFSSAGSQGCGLRGGSYTYAYDNNICQGQLPTLGHRDGPGVMIIDGNFVGCDYIIPFLVADGSRTSVTSNGYLWLHNGGSSGIGYYVGSGSMLTYVNAPALTGTSPTKATSVGGTQAVGLSLPIYNTSNGAGIVVDQ